jgi:hypothetical protein
MSTKLQTSNIGDSDCDLLSWGQKKSPNVKIGANSLIVLSGELIVTKSSNYARLQPNRSHLWHLTQSQSINKVPTRFDVYIKGNRNDFFATRGADIAIVTGFGMDLLVIYY